MLLQYVVSTSYRKMRRRLVTPLSTQYHDHLNRIASHKSFLFNQPPQGWISSTVGDRSDIILRGYITSPTFFGDLGIDIPQRLRQAAKNSQNLKQTTQLYQTIYTKESFKDYHALLCALLLAYAKGLENLTRSFEFEKNVRRVRSLGHILDRMTSGSIMERHLQNIDSLLQDYRRGKNMQKDEDADTEEDTDMDEDADLEAEVIDLDDNSESPTQLWKLYIKWLKLMVVQFKAAETLIHYVRSQAFIKTFNGISVKVLVLPFVAVAALPLTTLLERPELFPATAAGTDQRDRNHPAPLMSNKDLLQFVDWVQPLMEGLIELEGFVRSIKAAKPMTTSLPWVEKAIAVLETWPKRFPSLLKWQGHGEELKDHFLALQNHPNFATDSPQIKKITKRLAELKKSARAFAFMKKDITPELADTAGHCESSLASFLVLSPGVFGGIYDKVIQEFQVNFVIFSLPLGCDLCFYFKGFRPCHRSLTTFLPNMPYLD